MTPREEEITQAALEMYSGAVSGHLAMRVGFETGAKWSDEHPKPNLVDIDKVCKWLEEHYQQYDEIGLDMYGQLITENLRKDMMEE